jgi:hypothetical protein
MWTLPFYLNYALERKLVSAADKRLRFENLDSPHTSLALQQRPARLVCDLVLKVGRIMNYNSGLDSLVTSEGRKAQRKRSRYTLLSTIWIKQTQTLQLKRYLCLPEFNIGNYL